MRNRAGPAASPLPLAISRALVYACALAPLVVLPGVYLPYVVPRAVFFRAAVLLAVLPLGWAFLTRGTRLRRDDPLFWGLLAFTGVAGATAMVGESPIRSIYSDMERMWGVLAWAHLLLFYVLLRSVIGGRDWGRMLDVCAVVGAAVAGVGLLQYLAPRFPDWLAARVAVEAYARPVSTAGNPGYLAAYLVLAAALAAMRAVDTGRAGWRWVLVVLAIAEVGVALLTQSRGAMVGLAAGAIVAAVLVAVRGRGRVRVGAAAACVAILGAGAGAAASGGDLLREIPLTARFAGSSENPRLPVWKAAVDAWLERPILGVGLENAHVAISRAGGNDLYDQQASEGIWDRVHDVFLEALLTAGVAGLIAYAAIWVGMFVILVRARRRGALTEAQLVVALAALVAYLVHLSFWFEEWVSFPAALVLVAYAARGAPEEAPLVEFGAERPNAPNHPRLLLGFAAVTMAVVLLQWGARPLGAAWFTGRAVVAGALPEQVPAYERAADWAGVQGQQVFFEMTHALRTSTPVTTADTIALVRGIAAALELADRQIGIDPSNDMLHAHRSDLLRKRLQLDPQRATYLEAVEAADRAIALAPYRMENRYRLAELHLYVRESARALAVLDEARAVRDDMAPTDQLAATAAAQAGRLEEGFEWARRSLTRHGSSPVFLESLAERFAAADRPDLGARILDEYLVERYGDLAEPTDSASGRPDLPLREPDRTIAARLPLDYLRLGNRGAAARTARSLLRYEPGAGPAIRRFLDDLAAGRDSAWTRRAAIPLPPPDTLLPR